MSFSGSALAAWTDPDAGDIPSREEDIEALEPLRRAGAAVFTLDYAILPENVEWAESRSRERGFVPTVSRTPLDRLPSAASPR